MAFYMDSKRIPPERLVDRPPQQYDRILQTFDIDGARSKIKKFDPESHNYSLKTNDIQGAQPKKKIRNIWGSYNYNPTDKSLYERQPYSVQNSNNQNIQQQQYQNGQQDNQYQQQQQQSQVLDRRYNERPQDQIKSQGIMQNQSYQGSFQNYPTQQYQQNQQPSQMENYSRNQDVTQKQDHYRQIQNQMQRFDGQGLQEMQNDNKNYMMQRNQSSRQSQPNLAKYGQNLIQQNNYQSQQPQDYNYQQPQQQQYQQQNQYDQAQQNQGYEQQQQQNIQRPSSNNNNINNKQDNYNDNNQQQQYQDSQDNQQNNQQQQTKTWDKYKYNLIGGFVEDKRDNKRDQSSALERQYYENYNQDMAKNMRRSLAMDDRYKMYNDNLPQVKVDQRKLDYNSPEEVEKAQQNLRKYQFNNNLGKSGFYDEFQLKPPIASHSKQYIQNTVPQNNYPTHPQRYGPNAQQTLPNKLLD